MLFMPCSIAAFAATSAACCAANGVPFLEPLNPWAPDEDHDIRFPCGSVMVTSVLLNVDLMWATPDSTFLRSRLFVLACFLAAIP